MKGGSVYTETIPRPLTLTHPRHPRKMTLQLTNLKRKVFGGEMLSIPRSVASRRTDPQGIDISENNGDFDWAAWNGHIEFAGIKATEGPIPHLEFPHGYRDHQFARNWAEAKKLGIFRFPYHYFHPEFDPAQQARFFVDTVAAQGLEQHDNFYIDLEETGNLKPIKVSFAAWVFCTEVNRLSFQLSGKPHRVLVYTYPFFAEQGNCAMLGKRPLGIANYDTPSPHIPPPWSSQDET